MAKAIQIRSITLSAAAGHANIQNVLKNPKKYGLPDGANNKVLILAMLDRYANELIKRHGSNDSGDDSGGDKATCTHNNDDGSDDAMMLIG